MTDSRSTTAARLTPWIPLLFGFLSISYLVTWWLRGNTTNLFFGIGMALVAQQSYFYPRPGAGSFRSKPGPPQYRLLSETMSTIGVVVAIAAMVAAWL
jgi:hypothetical protein